MPFLKNLFSLLSLDIFKNLLKNSNFFTIRKSEKKKKNAVVTRPLEKKELKASNIGLHPGDLLLEKMVMFY